MNRFSQSRLFACVLILTAVMLASVGMTRVWAFCLTPTTSLSASTISAGTASVTLSGVDTCVSPGSTITVELFSGTCSSHSTTPISTFFPTTSIILVHEGSFSQVIPTSSLSAGSYCVVSSDTAASPIPSDPFAVIPAVIPEYPLGLPLVAILMMLGYAVIKRKT